MKGETVKKDKATKRGIDECPVHECGAVVLGIDAAEVHEGATYKCHVGHDLVASVDDGKAFLEQVFYDDEDDEDDDDPWDVVHKRKGVETAKLPVPGGWLFRVTSRKGVALAFVPGADEDDEDE
jgi:hypothetical protein